MEVIPPEYSLVGMVAPLEFHCSTALVHPAPRLSWTVRDWEDTELDHQELSTNMSSLLHSHWSSSNENRFHWSRALECCLRQQFSAIKNHLEHPKPKF